MDSIDTLNSLYDYIYNTLFEKYKRNRQTELEPAWLKCYNAYHKIDTGLTWKKGEKSDKWRSETYIDITRQKVLAGANFVSDMLFKHNEIPFQLEDPLMPNMVDRADDIEMETLIKYQLNRSGALEALDAMFLDGACYGEGIVRYFVDEKDKIKFAEVEDNFVEVIEKTQEQEVSHVSIWNIFRDIEVPFRESEGIIERSYITKADLADMIDDRYVIKSNLKRAIKSSNNDEAFSYDNDIPSLADTPERTRGLELLECWCRVPVKLLKGADIELESDDFEKMRYVKAVICNGVIIKFVEVQKRDMPYYNFIWEQNVDKPNGVGVGDNVAPYQKVINGAIRAFEDNKKLSGNVLFAGRSGYIKNLDEGFDVGKILEIEGTVDNIDEVLRQYIVPDVGNGLLAVINEMMQMADMSSGIPRTSQGQESANPQTAYEIQQRLERAGKYIGKVITRADSVISALVGRFYNYNMTDASIPKEIKFPYEVRAIGFASYEARMVRMQKLMQTLQLFSQSPSLHEQYKMDYLVKEILESNDINPKLMIKSPEEKQAEAEAQQAQQEIVARRESAEVRKIEAETKGILHEIANKDAERIGNELERDAEREMAREGQ